MIQLNLLPDVKINYIKAKRNKRMVVSISLIVIAVSIALFLLMFSFVQVQKKHMANLSNDVTKYTTQLNSTPDVGKVLTIQNQLNNVDGLHDQKPVTSRLFGYIPIITPDQVSFSEISLDLAENTITFSGKADSLATVNKFVDTLKFTDYTTADKQTAKAFSEVVLVSFSKGPDGTTYQITMKYDPVIFDGASEVTLKVPNIISTRSTVEKPSALFQGSSNEGVQ